MEFMGLLIGACTGIILFRRKEEGLRDIINHYFVTLYFWSGYGVVCGLLINTIADSQCEDVEIRE